MRAYAPSQRFSVAQWAVAPGEDTKNQSAYTGFPERIAINPDFFKRLDARLEVLTQAGILSAIVPLLELQSEKGIGRSPSPTTRRSCSSVISSPAGAPSPWRGWSPSRGTARARTSVAGSVSGRRCSAPARTRRWCFSRRDAVAVGRVSRSEVGGRVRVPKRDGRNGRRPQVDVYGAVRGGMEEGTDPAPDLHLRLARTAWRRSPANASAQTTCGTRFIGVCSWRRPPGLATAARAWWTGTPAVGPKAEQSRGRRPADVAQGVVHACRQADVHLARFMNSIDFWRLRPEPEGRRLAAGPTIAAAVHHCGWLRSQRPCGRLCAGGPHCGIIPGRAPALAGGQLVQSAHRGE